MKSLENIEAILLSAGRGKRMRYKTKYIAKPLVKVLQKPMLEINLNYLSSLGIKNCIINNSYKNKTIDSFIKNYSYKNKVPIITSSFEEKRLETGGGIKNALHFFRNDYILAINGDSLLVHHKNYCPVTELYKRFEKEKMSVLLLLASIKDSIGYKGNGDFIMQSKSSTFKIKRKNNNNNEGLVFTGWQIIKKDLFKKISERKFSLNLLYDLAENHNGLYGTKINGNFLHASTPKSLIQIEKFINENNYKL